MLKNGNKEHIIDQVKMLQRDKMPLREKMSQFMGKIGHKTIITNYNTGLKCHRRGWPYYRGLKCHIVTFSPKFWV